MSKQIFPKWTNFLPVIILVSLTVILGVTVHLFWYWFSPKHLNVGYQPKQPIPFSHSLHVSKVGLDCRYCHSNVEKAAHSNIPTTETCMNCHKNVKVDSPHIKKLTEHYESGTPIEWVRVHMLPDYAYFNHSAHVNVGVSCVQCHGQVNKMDVVYQAKPLSMGWCLDCHRDPAKHIRPDNVSVTQMDWVAPEGHEEIMNEYIKIHGISPPEDCTACHR